VAGLEDISSKTAMLPCAYFTVPQEYDRPFVFAVGVAFVELGSFFHAQLVNCADMDPISTGIDFVLDIPPLSDRAEVPTFDFMQPVPFTLTSLIRCWHLPNLAL